MYFRSKLIPLASIVARPRQGRPLRPPTSPPPSISFYRIHLLPPLPHIYTQPPLSCTPCPFLPICSFNRLRLILVTPRPDPHPPPHQTNAFHPCLIKLPSEARQSFRTCSIPLVSTVTLVSPSGHSSILRSRAHKPHRLDRHKQLVHCFVPIHCPPSTEPEARIERDLLLARRGLRALGTYTTRPGDLVRPVQQQARKSTPLNPPPPTPSSLLYSTSAHGSCSYATRFESIDVVFIFLPPNVTAKYHLILRWPLGPSIQKVLDRPLPVDECQREGSGD